MARKDEPIKVIRVLVLDDVREDDESIPETIAAALGR